MRGGALQQHAEAGMLKLFDLARGAHKRNMLGGYVYQIHEGHLHHKYASDASAGGGTAVVRA